MKIASKVTGFSFAFLAMLWISSAANAQEGKGKGGDPKGKGGARQRGGEKREQGARGGGRQAQDPAKMVEEMLAKFDKDGDKKLDAKELVAMFTEMRQSRGARGGRGVAGGGAGQRGGPGGPSGRGSKGGGRGQSKDGDGGDN